MQKATSYNTFYESIFIPGITVYYTDFEMALESFDDMQNSIKVIFEIRDAQDKLVEVDKITQNEND